MFTSRRKSSISFDSVQPYARLVSAVEALVSDANRRFSQVSVLCNFDRGDYCDGTLIPPCFISASVCLLLVASNLFGFCDLFRDVDEYPQAPPPQVVT